MSSGKVLKLSMPVVPGALVILLYHAFPLFPLYLGPNGGRYREREKNQKGAWPHFPGITVPLNREEGSLPPEVCLLQISIAATTSTTTGFLGDWSVREQRRER